MPSLAALAFRLVLAAVGPAVGALVDAAGLDVGLAVLAAAGALLPALGGGAVAE